MDITEQLDELIDVQDSITHLVEGCQIGRQLDILQDRRGIIKKGIIMYVKKMEVQLGSLSDEELRMEAARIEELRMEAAITCTTGICPHCHHPEGKHDDMCRMMKRRYWRELARLA